MKAIIFAAGKGVRMRPLTLEKPKPMIQVSGKPLLEHIINALPDEITEIILVVGYKGAMIKEHFGSEWQGKKISYLEQTEQLGTGHALMLLKGYILPGEKFLLVYADDLRDKESLKRGLSREHAIFVKEMADPGRFGTVVLGDGGKIIDMEEKAEHPKTNLVVTGAYVLTSKIFDHPPALEDNGEYFINSMLRGLMQGEDVHAEISSIWIPIGYPEDIALAEKFFEEGGSL